MKKILKIILFTLFIWYVKICVDDLNNQAKLHDKQMKKYCPCGEWVYVSRRNWKCKCPDD